MRRFQFDKAYYDRYYRNRHTRVEGAPERRARGAFVAGYLRHLDLPVRRVLDLGCGLGAWRGMMARHFPGVDYLGVEFSEYLCMRYGWQQGSVVNFRAGRQFDLVICQEVLPYLGDVAARRAIVNLHRHCCGALYLQTITAGDWAVHCDQRYTDGTVYLRPAAWYRRELGKRFINAGGGLFLPRESPVVLYELERAE